MRFGGPPSLACACLIVSGACSAASAQLMAQAALHHALAQSGARGVVMDVASGRVLASEGLRAARGHGLHDTIEAGAAPGSTLKPFVLLAALERGVVGPQTTLECRGTLIVKGRNLACTHPRALSSFTAEQALAYSCNTYFAAIARRMDAPTLEGALERFGFHPGRSAAGPDERVLLVLGLDGVNVTTLELATAYRRLALAMQSAPKVPPARTALVQQALLDSVRYGMSNNAATDGVVLAGKTGTASGPRQAWTHGWFAGIVYDAVLSPRQVVVIYVPRGSGADAAFLAHRYLLAERQP